MGKKGRKTRWRTLTITDEHSDSEESNTTTSGHRVSKGYPQKSSYYGRFTYSSQSTPTRRYQCDGTKSTRSSSTASENKITFNEDEYTRITTPRQDVLFKKGYLNKPKAYQTQTSTGNSTTSTGNSTGNGTPDHQSTDLEYESQFVFPNGFVDQNGIYYVNSFEPYPLMVFNPPTYYPDFNSVKSKRCSTGSLTESTSPNNEETSQDLSQSETPSNVSDFNQVYNVIYPGFYFNGACQPQDAANHNYHHHQPEPRRMKKKRRRRPSRSKSVQEATTSEYTDDSSDEVFSDHQDPEDAQKTLLDKEQEKEESHEDNTEDMEEEEEPKKYDLKPDAEEFVPRAYRQPIEPNVQFIKIPSNFVPLPIINPLDGFGGQNFNAFIPPAAIPINFIPHFIPNYVGKEAPQPHRISEKAEPEEAAKETVEVPKNQIDIAKIVSKLEEAAKEQDEVPDEEDKRSPKKTKHFKEPTPKQEVPTSPPKLVRNYSDTLKKSPPQVQSERHLDRHLDHQRSPKTAPKEVVKNHVRAEPPTAKTSNQWISVSNRKKRKNRNVEEEFEEEPQAEDGIEEVTATIPPTEEKTTTTATTTVQVEEVKVEELPAKEEEEVKEEKKKIAPKKRSKKSTGPKVTKRVIIKDVDLSQDAVEEPVEVKEVVEQKEEPPPEVEVVPEPPPEEERKDTSPEKKAKRKKKKPKPLLGESATTTTVDDSYDFLLEEASKEKTNVEVSQELDKMIQRGMYSSLEGKIRALNIESNDNFFKTIIHNISRESSVEKNNFGKLLQNPTLLQSKPSTVELKTLGDFLGEGTPKPHAGGEPHEEQYPITRAVKEWMTKTRENTPDVEIFKSPSTIFREFNDNDDDDDDDDEDEDLLEYWEDPVVLSNGGPSLIEEEDLVRMKREVEENRGSYPKHGNLPYRAICCSIM